MLKEKSEGNTTFAVNAGELFWIACFRSYSMRKVLIFLFLLSALSVAQNYNGNYQNVAMGPTSSFTSTIQAIPNATVTVFNCVGAGHTCGTLSAASLCTSITDTVCNQSNVLFADVQGNFSFYIRPGRYAYNVVGMGFASKTFLDIIINAALTDPGGGGLPSNAQIGDGLRYNVNGDNNFDAVNANTVRAGLIPVFGGNPVGLDACNGVGFTGSHNNNTFPTATTGVVDTWTASATPSTNAVIGFNGGQNGSNSTCPLLAFYRFSTKIALGNTTNVRYWLGQSTWSTGSGHGNNGQAIAGTSAYATDTPNKNTLGFRFSAGTDTHWQAVAATGGGSQTTVDTGITPDTNFHLFEMTLNSTGTSVNYFIDNSLVATISTNIPTPAVEMIGEFFLTGDNKNTSTAISVSHLWTLVTYR